MLMELSRFYQGLSGEKISWPFISEDTFIKMAESITLVMILFKA